MDKSKTEVSNEKMGTFILFYRCSNNPNLTKVFEFMGDQKAATERARVHCQRMGYQFILCRRFLVDLDQQEVAKREDPEYSESPR